jgi:hypothetical protein
MDESIKKFVNEIAIGFADELREILTDYSSFKERLQYQQNERLDEIVEALDFIAARLTNITKAIRGHDDAAE